ncbi:MAG: TRIC cation channel family protein [Cyanobium sp. M30B3]|nr:MAG: TRIC cation channel family protein [Cyanobium sp. M30B3]
MITNELSQIASQAGTVAFTATAVLAMAPFRVDLLKALVMGLMTAIGGGTVWDLILQSRCSGLTTSPTSGSHFWQVRLRFWAIA